MNGRGLGSAFRTSTLPSAGTADVCRPIDGLEAAVRAARGRLDDTRLDTTEVAVDKARARLNLSTDHMIVAIAGATGSGKSTLFNALAGVTLSASGPERPTTSTTTALVCGDDDVDDLLDWLGVPEPNRHRTAARAPLAPTTRLPDGLVLLDLPDHDSIAIAHHQEAERVVALADLLVWVVDPQKYADAALHRRLLQPHARHREVMMVVLNHIDTVPEERRAPMLRDVRKVVVEDGIRDPLVLATSAREGIGMKELRAAIRRRVEEKRHVALRVRADLRTSAAALHEAAGDAPPTVPDPWIADLEQRLTEAAGVPGLVERSRRTLKAEAVRQLRWPVRASRGAAPVAGGAPHGPGPGDWAAVETATRDLTDKVCRNLGDAWGDPIRRVVAAATDATCERLDAELAASPPAALPDWLDLLKPVRAVLLLCALASLAILGISAVRGAGGALAFLGVAGLVVGFGGLLVILFGADLVAERVARQSSAAMDRALHAVVARVAVDHVVRPVNAELLSYRQFRQALDTARS